MIKNFLTLFSAALLVAGFTTGANAQSIFEQIAEGAKHVVNEADKIVRDTAPAQIDFNKGGRVIVNGPVNSWAWDPSTGNTNTTVSPTRRFVEGLPGVPMCAGVRAAKSAIRTRFQLPTDVQRDLIALGVPAHIVRKTTWSPDWYATNYMPGTGNQGAVVVEDVVIISDNRLVTDRSFMAHELKHVQQYERLGTDAFCVQYTTNSWIFENEAKDEEARVERALTARAQQASGIPSQAIAAYFKPSQQASGASAQARAAYFNVNGAFYFGDANYVLYPANPTTGQVVGPATARVVMQNGQYFAVDGFGRSYMMQRVR